MAVAILAVTGFVLVIAVWLALFTSFFGLYGFDILLSNDTFYENSDLLEIVLTNLIAGATSVATWLFGASVYRLTASNADRVQGVFM